MVAGSLFCGLSLEVNAFVSQKINVMDAPYEYMTDGAYEQNGTYNSHPIYTRESHGYTLSVYRRNNGRWYLDFNDVSEDWSGTLSWSMSPTDAPTGLAWRNGSVSQRKTISMGGMSYSDMTENQYTFTGTYNGFPVYTRDLDGNALSVYRKLNGAWFLDSNELDETFSGWMDFSSAASTPWDGEWRYTTGVSWSLMDCIEEQGRCNASFLNKGLDRYAGLNTDQWPAIFFDKSAVSAGTFRVERVSNAPDYVTITLELSWESFRMCAINSGGYRKSSLNRGAYPDLIMYEGNQCQWKIEEVAGDTIRLKSRWLIETNSDASFLNCYRTYDCIFTYYNETTTTTEFEVKLID